MINSGEICDDKSSSNESNIEIMSGDHINQSVQRQSSSHQKPESVNQTPTGNVTQWSPSGYWFKDLMFFVGPGWMVSIAYVDPGNYQADIQAGALSRYSLLFIIWWTSMLSIYVQILCVRLSYHGRVTLAEALAKFVSPSKRMRYLNWFIAEISIVITDLPEVIGIGIACNVFFGWPYWVGVILSLLTTMVFLMTLHYSTKVLEIIVASFVGIMVIALFVEMNFVGVDTSEMFQGWVFGIAEFKQSDIFAITGVVGSVVMPHNLHLHTSACQSRSSQIHKEHIEKAVFWSSIEPILPVIISFLVNLAVLAIAAERVYGQEGAVDVGLTDFCTYFEKLVAGCSLWGIALLASGQSSAITTTYTGQYVMDGFLDLQLPIKTRAIVTRLIAITPCIITSVFIPNKLNQAINIVNAALSFLLPFAFTPLVLLNCSESVMGPNASRGFEKVLLHAFAFAVWLINAVGLSIPGGGFFGDLREYRVSMGLFSSNFPLLVIEISTQIFYFWWNWQCIRANVTNNRMEAVHQLEEVGVNNEHEMI